jgi:4-amino-4-deoxy-L-arabinose transferase-like glycosyltransferase
MAVGSSATRSATETDAAPQLRTATPIVRSVALITAQEPPSESPDLHPQVYSQSVRRLLLALLAIGVVLRLVRLIIPAPIWGDEAMIALNFVDRDYLGLTRFLDHGQVAPVLFLWVERFIATTLGTADWMVRLAPFLASTGALFLFWDFARRTVSPTSAMIAVGLLSVSVWPVSMAATVKPYAGDLFWSTLLLVLASRWREQPQRLSWLVVLVLATPFALASSYPAVFVAAGASLYLLPIAWSSQRSAQYLFAAFNLAMIATFLTTYLFVGRAQIDPAAGTTGSFMLWYWRHGFPPDSLWQTPLWFLQANTGRMFAYPLGDSNGGSSFSALLFAVGIWTCRQRETHGLLILCLAPFALNLLAAVLGKYPYAGCCRLSQHLAPAICLLIGVGSAHVIERLSPRLAGRLALVQWVTVVLIVMGSGGLIYRCVKLDHDPLARFSAHLYSELLQEVRDGDLVAVSDLEGCDVDAQWYLKRFGPRLVALRAGDALPRTEGRVWVVSMHPAESRQAHHELLKSAPAGWRASETLSYSIRPDPNDSNQVWWFADVTCLIPPGDPRPAPRLNVGP